MTRSTSIIISIIFLAICTIIYFVNKKQNKKDSELLIEFRKKAENDIKNDDVKIFGGGLPLPPKNERDGEKQKQIEIVRLKYGLHPKNLGCTISDELTKAQEEYIKLTDVYLNKRNGKGWRETMEKQIDSIKKNYR